MPIPAERLRFTANWLYQLREYWDLELPLRIHSRETNEGGSPEWHPDFANWLMGGNLNDQKWRDNPEPRVRTTRAVRKLREKYPREYEVLYRVAILDHTINDTANWLNARAIKNQKPERYSREAVLLYLLNGAEKTHAWW